MRVIGNILHSIKRTARFGGNVDVRFPSLILVVKYVLGNCVSGVHVLPPSAGNAPKLALRSARFQCISLL